MKQAPSPPYHQTLCIPHLLILEDCLGTGAGAGGGGDAGPVAVLPGGILGNGAAFSPDGGRGARAGSDLAAFLPFFMFVYLQSLLMTKNILD